MTDLDPEIWNNETLGAAANNERLDRLERQQLEDRSAKLENREPREIVVDNTYPDWTPEVNPRTGTVASNFTPVRFADEQPNDVVQTGTDMKPEGMSDEEWSGNSEGSTVSDESEPQQDGSTESVHGESESPMFDSTPQEDAE
jgi:hypothetical protein